MYLLFFFIIFYAHCCLCLISVSSISSPAGILNHELSKREQPSLPPARLDCGSAGGKWRGPHACLHLFLLAEPGSQQHRPSEHFCSHESLSLSQLPPYCVEGSPVLAAPISQSRAGWGWRWHHCVRSAQCQQQQQQTAAATLVGAGGGWQWTPYDPPRWR